MIPAMTPLKPPEENSAKPKKMVSLWQSIILVTLLVCVVVSLFGAIIFMFISGAQQLGLPATVYIIIFVVISGIFAWVIKRITDTAAGMSQLWFPEDSDEEN